MENIIQKQKNIASNIYVKLKKLNKNVLLAGGAPRDWFLNKVANDLDFYIYYNPENKRLKYYLDNLSFFKNIISSIGLNLELKNPFFCDKQGWMFYERNPKILCVYEGLFDGQSVQIIFMRNEFNIYDLLNDFALDICQIAWENNEYYKTKLFDESLNHKIIRIVNSLYDDKDGYVQKIKNKFTDYLFLGKINSPID